MLLGDNIVKETTCIITLGFIVYLYKQYMQVTTWTKNIYNFVLIVTVIVL